MLRLATIICFALFVVGTAFAQTSDIASLREKAEQGDADAQYNLGVMYLHGRGVPQDYVEAAKWYRKAAERGHVIAQTWIGMRYYNGDWVPQDYKEAAKWFRKAADQGHTDAQFLLGGMYTEGQGAPQDYGEAVKWFRKAADQGIAKAQAALGAMYALGRGVSQDYVQSHTWYHLAAVNDATGKKYAELRDKVAAHMTPVQITEAQKLAREWQAAHPKRQWVRQEKRKRLPGVAFVNRTKYPFRCYSSHG